MTLDARALESCRDGKHMRAYWSDVFCGCGDVTVSVAHSSTGGDTLCRVDESLPALTSLERIAPDPEQPTH